MQPPFQAPRHLQKKRSSGAPETAIPLLEDGRIASCGSQNDHFLKKWLFWAPDPAIPPLRRVLPASAEELQPLSNKKTTFLAIWPKKVVIWISGGCNSSVTAVRIAKRPLFKKVVVLSSGVCNSSIATASCRLLQNNCSLFRTKRPLFWQFCPKKWSFGAPQTAILLQKTVVSANKICPKNKKRRHRESNLNKKASAALKPDNYLEPKWLRCPLWALLRHVFKSAAR